MKTWLIENSWLLVLMISAFFYLVRRSQKVGYQRVMVDLRQLAFGFMVLAEKQFRNENGLVKMEWVIEQVYLHLPDTIKFFIPKDQIPLILQSIYDELKDYLKDGSYTQ